MILKKGDTGNRVRDLQRLLNITQDGIFGEDTERAVCEFQKSHSLVVDGIVGAQTWALLTDTFTVKKSRRRINEIFIHCSATREGINYTVDDIRRWHRMRGFSDIAYHYVIYIDGTIHCGRDVDKAGAHVVGHNRNSIGICYVGGVATNGKTAKDTRTEAQKRSLIKLLKQLRVLYPDAKIYGHRDFAAKACPCFDARNEYKDI